MSYQPNQGQWNGQQQQQQQYGQYGNGHPSQPYAQQYAPPQGQQNQQYYGPPQGAPPPQAQYGDNKQGQQPAPAGRFRPKKTIRDPIFLVLFIATVLGFAALSGIVINQFVKYGGLGGSVGKGRTGSAATLDYHTVYLLLFVAAAALVLSSLYLMLVRVATKIIMEVTLALSVLLNIGVCAYYFYIKYYSGAIIFAIISVIGIVSYWFMRKRIPLARLLLQIVMDISKHHPSVYIVVLLGLVVQTALSVWYSFACISVYTTYTPNSAACATNSCSSGKVTGLIVFSTFSYLWISQVVANVCLATLAGGAFGGWYYYGPSSAGNGQFNDGMPSKPNTKAFIRASTTSLGSIAFGSLIVTLLELLRQLLRVVAQSEANSGDTIGAIVGCIAVCCVGCIEGMVQWFNKYAYIEIALYGKSYIPAAKDTWRLLVDRGIDALVNDSLVSMTLTWGAYLVGALCGLFGYLYLRFTNPSYNADGQYSAVIILFSFLMGLNCGLTLGSALDAGVSTIFVGLGEDPHLLQRRSPELFGMIASMYPKVLTPVPGGV